MDLRTWLSHALKDMALGHGLGAGVEALKEQLSVHRPPARTGRLRRGADALRSIDEYNGTTSPMINQPMTHDAPAVTRASDARRPAGTVYTQPYVERALREC